MEEKVDKEKGNKENMLALCRSIIPSTNVSIHTESKALARLWYLPRNYKIIVKTGYFQLKFMHDSYFQTKNGV